MTEKQMSEICVRIIKIFQGYGISEEDEIDILKCIMYDVMCRMDLKSYEAEEIIANMVEEYSEFLKIGEDGKDE